MTATPMVPIMTAQSRGTETEVLDREALLDRLGGDEELVAEILLLFREQAPVLVNDIFAARAAGDTLALRREAHTLKGAAANVGADQLAGLGALLQRLAEEGELSQITRLESQLSEALEAFMDVSGGR